jgi:hypothetical protein
MEQVTSHIERDQAIGQTGFIAIVLLKPRPGEHDGAFCVANGAACYGRKLVIASSR